MRALLGAPAALLSLLLGAPTGPVVTVTDPRITESSGLAVSPTHPDLVWTVNDSGDSARAFAVSLTTGRTVAVLKKGEGGSLTVSRSPASKKATSG